ncbi:DegT/DnrJ/EryC1/StrS family aminotransferase [Marinobacter salicampi]|uniref:DegT/DnrJ/EryC1/StrS family aminotransferase n=1 Tax=Marinobacter salicampi TaxID=435907 RepID=UPI0014077675|nr:DegT/DnrJ/EryC1/StrS family aminotransferase [Marinobacter salicampi]
MSFRKLRPVGSRIPLPLGQAQRPAFSWEGDYHTEFVDSGTSALSLAIALAIGNHPEPVKAEVILPAYGCPDLVAAVLAQGAKPVLVDIAREEPRLDLAAVESAMGNNTVAIVAVNFVGIGERLPALRELADAGGAWLIEDSAQSFPPDSGTSALADCVVLSFGRGKPVNLMGGGALLIRKDHAEAAARTLGRYSQVRVSSGMPWTIKRWLFNLLLTRPMYGLAERLPFLGIGQTVFHPLHTITRQVPIEGLVDAGVQYHRNRPCLAASYDYALGLLTRRNWSLPAAARSQDKPSSQPGSQQALQPRLLRYPVLAPSRPIRDRALALLNRAGIGANAFYGTTLPQIAGLEHLPGFSSDAFPNARDFADRLLTLPVHEDVTSADIERTADILSHLSEPEDSAGLGRQPG